MPSGNTTGGRRRRPAPDYSNQLSLFADDTAPYLAVAEEPAPQTSELKAGAEVERQEPPGRTAPPAAPAAAAPQGQRTAPGTPPSAGEERGPAPQAGDSAPKALPAGVGGGHQEVDLPAERGPPAVLVREPDLERTPSRDFRITGTHRIGQGSLHEKARDNLAAIRTLKHLETENREATEAEQAILARYSGWGALPGVFRPYPTPEWLETAAELRELLTPEEYAAARASTPNAHYTSPAVISAMWEALRRFGLIPGAQILEPSMGIGHFFGLMPEELMQDGHRTGVELDPITAGIARRLYPGATIFAKGFEDTSLPDNFFDAVIGNIPFGNYPVFDPAYRRTPAVTRAIHDYFFAKSLDKLRPGGILALITSRYTMDKQDPTIRRYLADRAGLVGAIRLPNTAFKANAGTEVTTDILFLQKYGGEKRDGEAWLELTPIETPDGKLFVNEYFARHPGMMLGEMRLAGSMYRDREPALTGELTPERLAEAVASLPASIYARGVEPGGARGPSPAERAEIGAVKEGAFAERDGVIVVRNGDRLEPANIPSQAAWRVRGMLAIRDAVRLVFQTQLDDASEERITEARKLLNELYDSFVAWRGPLSSPENLRDFDGDPDQPLLLSLENYDPETKHATKTPIFHRRTLDRYRPVEHVETAAEALTVSLNETGEVKWERMEQVSGRGRRQLQFELRGLVYRNPEGDVWETADRYLSGNVRAKLAVARAAAGVEPRYEANVAALEAVQPADLEPGDIEARLGSSWIPASDVRDFIAGLLDIGPGQVRVAHAEAIATWTVEIEAAVKWSVSNTTAHGTARFRASDLIEQALNARTPTAYDEQPDGVRVINQAETIAAREKQQQLKDRFRAWVPPTRP